MLKSSRHLYQFYKDYLEWVDGGAVRHEIFTRDAGLCCNLYDYASVIGLNSGTLQLEMSSQFEDANLNQLLPFNQKINYHKEVSTNTCHENINRVQWVRDRVEDTKWMYGRIKVPLGKSC